MSSSPPTTLGQYQIIREIARSNDIVYEAYDPQMDRRVALKELNLPAGLNDAQREDRVQRFDREAKAAGRLAHPNIMRVFQVANDGDRHYMAMEYLDGHTLRNEIDTKGFLPVDRAVEVAIEVLKGLAHAHAHGVVHRDIKPDNIQILSSGEIKITDFGIARLTFQPNLTMDGQVFGTPSYMSPEQVVGREIDARSDLFSVGVLLYEMISGQKPFPGDSVVAITYAIMNKEPGPLTQVNHSLDQVIRRALDKSPALRFSSAQEMIDALENALHQSLILDAPMTPPGQTIYGPSGAYPAPPPVLDPYGQPYATNPYPPPVVQPPSYPYNPYAPPMVGGVPPSTFPPPGYAPPVFYPPPPRQPLVKPETRNFLGKLAISFLVVGTLVVVLIVGIMAVAQEWRKSEALRHDEQLVRQIHTILTGDADPRARIEQAAPLIGQLRSRENRLQENRELAVVYELIGQKAMDRSAYRDAEQAFTTANDLDPDNARLLSDLAALYTATAQSLPDPSQRANAYAEAIDWWRRAISIATEEDQAKYETAAGEVYYKLAVEQMNNGNLSAADDTLREGRTIVPEGSEIQRRLDDLDSQIVTGYQR